MNDNTLEVSVVAPVYNEQDVIEEVVSYWFEVLEKYGLSHEVVLGDGGSTDRTLDILKKIQEKHPTLKVVDAPRPSGYGNALFTAIYAAKGKHIVMLDSDGQFDLSDFTPMLDKLIAEQLDVVTGYRVRKQDTFMRYFADRVLNFIVRVLFSIKQKDTNCALKVFKGDLIRDIHIEARAWPTPTEIMLRLNARNSKVGEVPIVHHKRKGGETKLPLFRTGFEMFCFLLYFKYKLRLFKKNIITKI